MVPSELEKTQKKEQNAEIEETLYEALKKIGISNVTTLEKQLGIKPETPGIISDQETEARQNGEVLSRAKKLLALMGLDPSNENASFLEEICLQGKEMLGKVTKPTITPITPTPIERVRKKAIQTRTPDNTTPQ